MNTARQTSRLGAKDLLKNLLHMERKTDGGSSEN